MPKYTVISIIGASTAEEVEASSPEDAINQVSGSPSLCHQCAHEVDLGDPYEWVVLDESGAELLDTSKQKPTP